jgi:ligand-binding sensor domain-containing protein
MVVVGTSLFAVSDGGLLVHDFIAGTTRYVPSETPLSAVAVHAGRVYTGGDCLYVFDDSTLTDVDIDLPGSINDLASFNTRLLIGTDAGLVSSSLFGTEILLPDYWVTALTPAGEAVWVGTRGAGLFEFDGLDFRARYLARDPSLMNYVSALDFAHNHLYVGTDNGLFIFDGGRWQQLIEADGLPSDGVTAIDASNWAVTIGTDAGLISWFDGDFIEVPNLSTTPVVSVARFGSKIVVSSADSELLLRSGPAVRLLIPVHADSLKNLLSVLR